MRYEDIRTNCKLDGLNYLRNRFKRRRSVRVLPFEVFDRLEDIPIEKYRKAGHARLLIRSEPSHGKDISHEEWINSPRRHLDLTTPEAATRVLGELSQEAQEYRRHGPFRWIVHPLGEETENAIAGVVHIFGSNSLEIKVARPKSAESPPVWHLWHQPIWLRILHETKTGIPTTRVLKKAEVITPPLEELRQAGWTPKLAVRIKNVALELFKDVPDGRIVEARFSTVRRDPSTLVFYDYLHRGGVGGNRT